MNGNVNLNFFARVFSPPAVGVDLFLVGACFVGDWLLQIPLVAENEWGRALLDSITHATIGVLSWAVVLDLDLKKNKMVEMLLCGFLAAVIDLDHFIMAGSLDIKKALSLPRRPPFHLTSIIPPIGLLIYSIQKLFNCTAIPQLHWLFMVAWFSHHIRDAHRQGLWMWPLWNIPALHKSVYITMIALLPFLVKAITMSTEWFINKVRSSRHDGIVMV